MRVHPEKVVGFGVQGCWRNVVVSRVGGSGISSPIIVMFRDLGGSCRYRQFTFELIT